MACFESLNIPDSVIRINIYRDYLFSFVLFGIDTQTYFHWFDGCFFFLSFLWLFDIWTVHQKNFVVFSFSFIANIVNVVSMLIDLKWKQKTENQRHHLIHFNKKCFKLKKIQNIFKIERKVVIKQTIICCTNKSHKNINGEKKIESQMPKWREKCAKNNKMNRFRCCNMLFYHE